jgi:hypothetical protein
VRSWLPRFCFPRRIHDGIPRSGLRPLPRALALVLAGAAITLASAGPLVLPAGIPAAERVKLERVASSAVVSTHYEGESFAARPDVFEFLLDHPEFATHITRALRIARYRIWHTPEGMFLDDGWGAVGRFTIVHAGHGVRVVYASGQYEQAFVPTIRGEAVGVLTYATRPDADGHSRLVTSIDGYVKLDSGMLGMATRLAGPAAAHKADLEAKRLTRVFARTSRAIEENPAAVYESLRQRPDVPRAELEAFRDLLNLPRTSKP